MRSHARCSQLGLWGGSLVANEEIGVVPMLSTYTHKKSNRKADFFLLRITDPFRNNANLRLTRTVCPSFKANRYSFTAIVELFTSFGWSGRLFSAGERFKRCHVQLQSTSCAGLATTAHLSMQPESIASVLGCPPPRPPAPIGPAVSIFG